MRRLRKVPEPAHALLAMILVAGLALRLVNNDYGLPFAWSLDESTHFTNRAVDLFGGGIDPGYYQNPPLLTYLVYLVLRVLYGPLGAALPAGGVPDKFAADPTEVFVAARTLAAVLCMAGVGAIYGAGRRLFGTREGLVAAALLAFAFLPVAYSRVAVTDVGALAGVALALLGAVRGAETARRRDFLMAGAGVGLALSFKYTCGLLLLPVGLAAAMTVPRGRPQAALSLALATAGAALLFAALNPGLLANLGQAGADLRDQAEVTAQTRKPGQDTNGLTYYLGSLTWGLGWAAIAAAGAGLVLVARRDARRALLLAAFPLALFAYLALQSRYFGRWLLPAYPVLALLGAVALTRVAQLVRGRPGVSAAVLGALTLACLAQPLAADVRSAQVLGRDDTRQQVRDYLARSFPPALRASIEPDVPKRFFRVAPDGRDPAWLGRCPRRPGWRERGWSYPGPGGRRVCRRVRPGQITRPDGGLRASAYHLALDPAVIGQYRRYGYCLVVTFSVVRNRALGAGRPQARAYYRRLERESRLLRTFSPYDAGADPVPFSFDLSYNYEPAAFHRPGPVAKVYRLRRCRQRYGTPVIQIPRAREVPDGELEQEEG